jgi:hypothetical protein
MADTKSGRAKKALRELQAAERRKVDAYLEHADEEEPDLDELEADMDVDPDVLRAYLADDDSTSDETS